MSFKNADLTLKDLKDEKSEFCGVAFSPKKTRPKSRIAYSIDDKYVVHNKDDVQNPKKQFSAISSKPFCTLDKFTFEDSEDYTDSLEHSSLNRKANKQPYQSKLLNPASKPSDDGFSGENKFRKLQEKWEFMSGKEGNKIQSAVTTPSSPVRTFGKSKIPRLLTSPIKQLNVAASVAGKPIKSPVSGIPSLKKPATLPTATKATPKRPIDSKSVMKNVTRRTSRVDQDILGVPRIHTARPSSLPYKSHGITSNDKNVVSPHRRAASTSLPRPAFTAVSKTPVPKVSHK